jgi:hypothetical protein
MPLTPKKRHRSRRKTAQAMADAETLEVAV